MKQWGHFNDDGGAYIITTPETPRPFDHFLWNDAIFSNVQQTGVGYCDYQPGEDLEAVQLLTGNGRICDFDVFGRESLMSRLLYLRDNETGDFWNVNWEPCCHDYERFTCEHGIGYTAITSLTQGIEAVFTLFVPEGSDPLELWRLTLVNTSDRPRSLSLFAYNQFQLRYKWGFDSYGDMLYRSCDLDTSLNALLACKHPHMAPHDFLTGFFTANHPITAFDGCRDAFVGPYGNLSRPAGVVRGRLSNTPGSSDATVSAAQMDMTLAPQAEHTIEMMLGASNGPAHVQQLRDKYLGHFNEHFTTMQEAKRVLLARHRVHTPDAHFNRMFNTWMKMQSLFGARWCRWGWNGYRDIVQHGLGVASFWPERTRRIILEAVSYQYADGTALRGWNPADEKPYSDSSLWLTFTVCAYVRETGDTALLTETRPYYDQGADTVLGHMEQALTFLENHKGSHGLCLIKFGDWNDSLTAVGKQGRGESVWLSQAYGEALRQVAALYAFLADTAPDASGGLDRRSYAQKARDAQARYTAIRDAVNDSAWDGDWYARCFDDAGQKIGASENAEGRIFIEPQAWAMIADMAAPERADTLLAACDTLLGTPLGYRLLAPTFTRRDDRVGRITCLEPGICENGTIYTHTNIWMVLGLLRTGRREEAWALFKRITPGYYADDADPKRQCPAYVYANCYYGPDHKNNPYQMEFTWITGSIAWVNYVTAEALLGVSADYRGLTIDPRIPAEWDGFTYERVYRGATYLISVKRDAVSDTAVSVPRLAVDGTPIEGLLVAPFEDGGIHEITVRLPAAR